MCIFRLWPRLPERLEHLSEIGAHVFGQVLARRFDFDAHANIGRRITLLEITGDRRLFAIELFGGRQRAPERFNRVLESIGRWHVPINIGLPIIRQSGLR